MSSVAESRTGATGVQKVDQPDSLRSELALGLELVRDGQHSIGNAQRSSLEHR